ncbi:MAG: hypothetical protein QNJ65_05555 [Xenococcaceae cyanobacterium MO_234.B1]|nr:hypothetical protein [Xenococcaceae cyanobacterium MO_234.B1]
MQITSEFREIHCAVEPKSYDGRLLAAFRKTHKNNAKIRSYSGIDRNENNMVDIYL